jgi:hypothetical protein
VWKRALPTNHASWRSPAERPGPVVVDRTPHDPRRSPLAAPAAHRGDHGRRKLALASQYAQFGSFGVGLAFVTWFTGLAFLIVVAAVIAPALREGNDRFASWLRGGQPTALEPGAKPALPGPSRPMRLSDAFARGSQGSDLPEPNPPKTR